MCLRLCIYYKYSSILLINEEIKDLYSSQQSIVALLKPANPELIKLPNRIETISVFISSVLSFFPNPSLLTFHLNRLTLTQKALSGSLKLYQQDLSEYRKPPLDDSNPFFPYSSLLVSLLNELADQSNPQTLRQIIEDLSKLTKPPETPEPVQPTQTTTLEALGQAESLNYEPSIPEASPRTVVDFDMSSLKSALKQPSHKIMYKQVSTTGSIQISDKPFASASSNPDLKTPQFLKPSSFKDFLVFPQKSMITLEGSGENSDNEL